MFGMTDDEESVDKTPMASSSTAIISQDSINNKLVTIMADNGASGHYFNDAIIRDLKHHQQDYVHLAMFRKIFTTEACCKALSPTIAATKSSFGSISHWCPKLRATCSR